MRTKPASAQRSASAASGTRTRCEAVGGVQPGVVALRLDPAHLGARQHRGPPGQLDRDRPRRRRRAPDRRRRAAASDPAQRLGQPLRPQRLEQVVDRAEVERVDRALVVRGDEHHRRRVGEPAQHPGRAPGRPGRASGCRGRPRRRRRRAAPAAPSAASPAQCAPSSTRGRRRAGSRARPGPAARRRPRAPQEPARQRHRGVQRRAARRVELRDPHAHLRARAGRGLHDQSELVAEHRRSRSSMLPSPTCCPPSSRPRGRAAPSGSMPTPSSSTLIRQSVPASSATIETVPTPVLRRQPVPDRVLHQRLHAQERHRHRQHLRRDLQPHLQPVAEPGPLQRQVAVDRAQLLGQRGELAVRAERVAGEVGELQQQLPGPLRVGADERRDRGQRVVDEVRADLGPQRPHLGPHQPGPGLVQLGQLQLGRHPARGLQRGLHQPGPGLGRGHRGQRADDPVVAPRSAPPPRRGPGTRVAADSSLGPDDHRAAARQRAVGAAARRPARRGGRPGPPRPAAARCRRSPPPACRAACAGAGPTCRPRSPFSPSAQRRSGQRGGVQGLERDPFGRRGEAAPRPDPADRPDGQHHDQQQRDHQPRRTHTRMVAVGPAAAMDGQH